MAKTQAIQPAYEVLIIGGGPAGLAAAMGFGCLRRQVLLCDDLQPRNAPSEHINNFPGYDGIPPEIWRSTVRTELEKYPTIQLASQRVLHVEKWEAGFRAQLQSGEVLQVQKVLLAYGIRDALPAIENIDTLWGQTVVHCPYCHGFEFQDQALGLLGDGEMAFHLLALLLGLSPDLVLFSNGPSSLNEAQRQKLAAQHIRLVETPVKKLEHSDKDGKQLSALVLENGEVVPRQALYLMPQFPFGHSSTIGAELGCRVEPAFGWYEVDGFGQTSVPGVYAAGDIAGMGQGQSVLLSAASGSKVAARIISELLTAKAGF